MFSATILAIVEPLGRLELRLLVKKRLTSYQIPQLSPYVSLCGHRDWPCLRGWQDCGKLLIWYWKLDKVWGKLWAYENKEYERVESSRATEEGLRGYYKKLVRAKGSRHEWIVVLCWTPSLGPAAALFPQRTAVTKLNTRESGNPEQGKSFHRPQIGISATNRPDKAKSRVDRSRACEDAPPRQRQSGIKLLREVTWRRDHDVNIAIIHSVWLSTTCRKTLVLNAPWGVDRTRISSWLSWCS